MTEPRTNMTNETDNKADNVSVWTPYEPDDDAPWNLRRVVHLHRRVVFGACWTEIQRDLAEGPEAAVSRVLDGTVRAEGVPEGFEQLAGVIGAAAVDSGSAERLKAWWLYRCLFSPHPLEERLTLMWHNHFATSNLKVNDLRLMKQQNDTLRKHALSPFGVILRDIVHDPALLEWLDASSNRAGQPNENLARELMELFALGIGNYSEDDVKEAARALTGWTVRQNEFRNLESLHDEGEKTILSRTGNFDGDDLVDILIDEPAVARRLAWRLTNEFFGTGVVDDSALDELAEGLRTHNLDIHWGVGYPSTPIAPISAAWPSGSMPGCQNGNTTALAGSVGPQILSTPQTPPHPIQSMSAKMSLRSSRFAASTRSFRSLTKTMRSTAANRANAVSIFREDDLTLANPFAAQHWLADQTRMICRHMSPAR